MGACVAGPGLYTLASEDALSKFMDLCTLHMWQECLFL